MAEIKDRNTMGNVIRFTREYLDSIYIEERLVGAKEPNLQMELFGETFASPIMTPAFSHLRTFASERENALCEYSRAAAEMNQVNWVGMSTNEEFAEALATGARTIRIIKPYADKDQIYSRIEFAEKEGALAVGIDIDHVFGETGAYDVCFGNPMTCQTVSDLKGYVNSTKLPFVIKGVLSVQDAAACAEAGVRGIVVSHHHGRMPFAIPPVMILPEIVKELGEREKRRVKVFVDCSMDSGVDAFKALALGADAVSAGRILMPGLVKEGCQGVKAKLKAMNEELAEIMAYTGTGSLAGMDGTVLHRKDGSRLIE